ncbi:Ankyrin repeat domain-containing protein 1 [Hondaea fermentalgiana]|uniref:Ankyrin repeat domain-containing protein 1 n=1 Tax=Hondaea fermentalgiana TaxID=2315210 RepID=A0A2R5GLH0_9STRA|nr:Ankyrin repeat domain-containing protein 1 [Hondaea fermentalgiana]|eukprot:GBG31159.1 Ankyrin repeat domain-containing protein 1 [Hondaea fermentalgiana]
MPSPAAKGGLSSSSTSTSQGESRKKRQAAEKQYRDFLYDVESSAKRILRDATKKRQAEAVRERLKRRQHHNVSHHTSAKTSLPPKAGEKRPQPPPPAAGGEDPSRPEVSRRNADDDAERRLALPENDREMTLRIPLPRGRESTAQQQLKHPHQRMEQQTKHETTSHSQSLPDLQSPARYKPKSTSVAASIIARVKEKLADSPLAPKSDAYHAGEARKQVKSERALQQQQRALEAAHMQARKPKPVDVVAHGSGKIVQLKGHFAPGTVPPRAEHAVPRRLALSAWLNPNKPSAVERGISSHALKALTQANELQGPTNWASVDLRAKYRDEKQRTEAWTASIERAIEAERLQREQQIFIPVVTIGEHPIHIDFKEWIAQENIAAAKQARARNRLKTFAYDLPVIWNANRPEDPVEDLASRSAQAQGAYPPPPRGVQGIQGRRDVLAHEDRDCQVQSVTADRAMQGAVRVSEMLKLQRTESESSHVQKKLSEMGRQRATKRLVTGASILERVLSRERRLHRAQDADAIFRAIVLARGDGSIVQHDEEDRASIQTSENDAPEEKSTAAATAGRESILISVFKDPDSYAVHAYSFADSTEFATDIAVGDFDELVEKEFAVRQHEQAALAALHAERIEIERTFREEQVAEAQAHEMALWWYAASVAAKRAHFQPSEDGFAELVGYSLQEARASAARVEGLIKRNLLAPKLAALAHRQCIRVPLLQAREDVGLRGSFTLTASVAAVREDDMEGTCVVLHLREVNTLASYGFCFSVSALRKWMQDAGLTDQVDLPPAMLKWWLLDSEWKTHVFSLLSRRVAIDSESMHARVPGLEIAQGALQYERMRRAAASVNDKIAAHELGLEALAPIESLPSLSQEEAIRRVLYKGFGIVARLWERKRALSFKRLKEKAAAAALEMSIGEISLTHESAMPMALAICGRRHGDANFIGKDPPSTSLHGRMGITPVLFSRDPEISSTNSVTCVVMTALDSPILAPVVMSFDPTQAYPVPAKEYLELPAHPVLTIAPHVVKRIISKLDFREASTIVVLNACAEEADLGLENQTLRPGEVTEAGAGHRRLEPEINPHCFRVWVLALREELCQPDPNVTSTVFGVTQSSATLNTPDTWPHRYTWHSDELVTQAITRPRTAADFAGVSHRGATVGSNDPNAYQSVMEAYDERLLARHPRTQLLKDLSDYEERMENAQQDELLVARMEAAAKSKARSEEERLLLEQELNDKRLRRERELRGKARESGAGAGSEDWRRRVADPTTRKLGRWRHWQAYLYLDHEAKEIVRRAAQQVELDQLARIAAGKRPKPRAELEEEAFSLAVREGMLFYHHKLDDFFQWDQPDGWEGVATVPDPLEEEEKDEILAAQEAQRELQRQSHNLRGDEGDLGEDAVALTQEFDEAQLSQKTDEELRVLQKAGAASALEAARQVEHSRRLRFIEENVRTWFDTKAGVASAGGVFDLRECFREMDLDRTGVLSYAEFKMGLANNALELPVEDQDTLIKHLDAREDGVVDYLEFVHWAIYTRPGSMYQWMEASMDLPDLGPNSWARMRASDKLLGTTALHEEYKETQTGQHYFRNLQTDEYTWIMPEVVALKKREDRDARELRQAQVAAALAAKAAAVSAAQAERASDRSMQRIVDHLSANADFVQLVADEMGLKQQQMRQDQGIFSTGPDAAGGGGPGLVPALQLDSGEDISGRLSSERSDLSSSCSEASFEGSELPIDPSKRTAATAATIDVEKASKKPGVEWRALRAGKLQGGFVTQAFTPKTRGADLMVYGRNFNRPSLVGVVDPADVSHIPFEDFAPVEVKFIADIMEDALRGTGMTKEEVLDKSDEEQMAEQILDAFLAVKNLNMERLEEAIEFGVNVAERDENGNTLFLMAAQQGSKRFVKFLLRRGADINAQNLQGNTALHYCFQYSYNELAEYLISKGADDSLLNKDGLTAYEGLHKEAVNSL